MSCMFLFSSFVVRRIIVVWRKARPRSFPIRYGKPFTKKARYYTKMSNSVFWTCYFNAAYPDLYRTSKHKTVEMVWKVTHYKR